MAAEQERFGKFVIPASIVVVVIALAAAATVWWRWERVQFVAGDIPLPPATILLESRLVEGGVSRCIYRCSIPQGTDAVRRFFAGELTGRGWHADESEESLLVFSTDDRTLRIVLEPRDGGTYFTLFLKPKTPP
jgi:hypothetical protein